MRCWKLFRKRANGTLGALFIDRRRVLEEGIWLEGAPHRTKGYAYRPGWHCLLERRAPHLSKRGRVWREVDVRDYELFERPESQGGKWALARWMRILGDE